MSSSCLTESDINNLTQSRDNLQFIDSKTITIVKLLRKWPLYNKDFEIRGGVGLEFSLFRLFLNPSKIFMNFWNLSTVKRHWLLFMKCLVLFVSYFRCVYGIPTCDVISLVRGCWKHLILLLTKIATSLCWIEQIIKFLCFRKYVWCWWTRFVLNFH